MGGVNKTLNIDLNSGRKCDVVAILTHLGTGSKMCSDAFRSNFSDWLLQGMSL